MRRILRAGGLLLAIVLVAAWWITRPQVIHADDLPDHVPDPAAGERIFWAGGCASCHAIPGGADRTLLAGGRELVSDFGTFVSPNISTHPEFGIGAWTLVDFATAMLEGTSPGGEHYYPAFPYASYARMTDQDVADLWAFLQTLPPSDAVNQPHDLAFPYSVRILDLSAKLRRLCAR